MSGHSLRARILLVRPGRQLRENIAALSVLQILCYIAPLVTVPYLVRVLKPPQFGLLAFAQSVALIFDLITDYGFNFTATRRVAAYRGDPFSISRIFWCVLWAKTILMLGSGIVLVMLIAFVPIFHEQPALYCLSFLYVIGTVVYPAWFFQGLEQMKISAIALGTARVLTVPALFLFVKHEQDYVIAAGIQASTQLVAGILVAPILLRYMSLRWYRPPLAEIGRAFREGWPLFASGSVLYLCTSSSIVVLGLVAGKTAVGYYSAAERLVKACISMLSPVTQALYPRIAAVKAASAHSARELIHKSFFSLGAISFCASIATLVLAGPICQFVLGRTFAQSAQVLQWLSPLPFLVGLMSVLGTQTMVVFEMDSMMCLVMLGGAVTGIPLIVLLSSLFGAVGAAAALTAITALMVSAMFVILRVRGLDVWRRSGPRNPNPLVLAGQNHLEI